MTKGRASTREKIRKLEKLVAAMSARIRALEQKFDEGIAARRDHPRLRLIQQTVADQFKISIDVMFSRIRSREYVHPRQIAMRLSRDFTDLSFDAIGAAFGGRDHGTVINACDAVRDRNSVDDRTREEFELVRAAVRGALDGEDLPLFAAAGALPPSDHPAGR